MAMDIKVLIQALFDGKGFETAGQEAEKFQSKGARVASGMDSAFKGLTGSIAVVGMAIGGITMAVNLAGSAIDRALGPSIEMEQLTTQFEVLLGGVDAAADRMLELTDFADKTPFELPGVAKASAVLQTLTRGALATGKGLTLVGDLAAGTGRPFDELAMWVGRLYDGLQSGRPVGEAMARLQELGAVSGSTRGQIEKLQASGAKGAEVWKIAEEAFSRYSGMMDKQSQTFAGLLSTLSDAFNGLLRVAFGDATQGSKSVLQFLIGLLTGLQEPLAEIIEDAKVFWASMYGDDAKSFGAFMSENALPALTALMGTMMDVGKIAVGMWESVKGVARLAMSGLFQMFQGLYALIMGIPAAFLLALDKVLGLIRAALNSLPPALRPEGVATFLAGQQAELQDTLGTIKTGFDTLGGMSQTFADQAAENFGSAGFALSQVGVDQGRRAGRKKSGAAGAGGGDAGTGDEGGDEKLSAAEKNQMQIDAFLNKQAEERAKHEEDLQSKLFETRKKGEQKSEELAKESFERVKQTTFTGAWFAEVDQRVRSLGTGFQQLARTMANIFDGAVNSLGNNLTAIITRTKSLTQGMKDLGREILQSVVGGIVQAGLKWIQMEIMKAAVSKAMVAASLAVAGAAATAASLLWVGPATLATIATMGGAAAAAPGEIAGSMAMTKALASFAVGSPRLPRDMVAMVHQDEIVAPVSESNAARAGNFGPLAKFLGVANQSAPGNGGDPQGNQSAFGSSLVLPDDIISMIKQRGSALVKITDDARKVSFG